jgi:hypothetical protein
MKSILIFGDDRETPAYVLKVSDKELAALEKANLIYIEASEAKDEKDTKQHAFNHIGVDLLRIADEVAEVSPKNFKELVPIFLERKTRKALMNLLATKAFEGMTYSHFVEMSMGSFVRGVTRKAFDTEKVQIEQEATKHGIKCSCPKAKDMVYSKACMVHGNWYTRYYNAMKVVPRLRK